MTTVGDVKITSALLEKLRAKAEGASKEEWRLVYPVFADSVDMNPEYGVEGPSDGGVVVVGYEEDADFIAAAQPVVVIALLDEIDRLRGIEDAICPKCGSNRGWVRPYDYINMAKLWTKRECKACKHVWSDPEK